MLEPKEIERELRLLSIAVWLLLFKMMLVTPNNGSQQVQFQIAEMGPEQGFSLEEFLSLHSLPTSLILEILHERNPSGLWEVR